MTEFFVGPIMEKIIDTCFQYLEDHVKRHAGMKELEERLRENHLTIQAVVSANQEHTIYKRRPLLINKWIWQLRDAIDEADDLLDEFAYMQHEEGLAKNKQTMMVRSPLQFLSESSSKIRRVGKGVFKTNSNLKRLEEVVQQLDRISAKVSTFLYVLEDTKQVQQVQEHELLRAREEGSFPKSSLIGRAEEKKYIIRWLRKPDETDITTDKLCNISFLSIVGPGGMGKTRLLQHVYQDEMTKDFDIKIWVCVSKHFDIKKLIADILESSEEDRPSLENINALQEKLKSSEEDRPSLENINALQEKLKSKVMFKKFLLVLDDIREAEWDINKWETVLAPLAYGKLGSKILLIQSGSTISFVMGKRIRKLVLEGLEEDECLLLLNAHAFANVKDQGDHKKLQSIARALVKKLSGSPLAAKVMGGVLNSNLDESHWINVLNNDLGRHNNSFPFLELSYIFLPKELRNCFTFCSIFPRDHNFDKDDLVRMWIAVGFIQPSDIQGGEDLEDVGERYFDLLVKKSFYDRIDIGCFTGYYKMQGLLHDMARSISTEECFRFVGDDQKLFISVPETIRHLSIKISNVQVLRNLRKVKNLRTLWITCDENNQDFDDVLTKIFNKNRSIRLLYIDNYSPKLMPKTISKLIHLRYLRLDFDDLTLFPITLSNLYHLQFIIDNSHFSPPLDDDIFPRDTRIDEGAGKASAS